jgi:hypothetical protein
MITRILFFLATLIFSSSAYADTYWFKGNKVKGKTVQNTLSLPMNTKFNWDLK